MRDRITTPGVWPSACLPLVVGLTLACGDIVPRTQVMVIVDAEPGVRSQTHDVEIVVRGGTGSSAQWQERLDRTLTIDDQTTWPFSIALVPLTDDPSRVYEFVATARATNGDAVGRVRAISGYREGRTLQLRLVFEDACRQQASSCGDAETCRDGACAGAAVDVVSLDAFKPDRDSDAGGSGGASGSGGVGGDGLCADQNGGCDSLTMCQVAADAVVCGSCPPGYSGDGYEGCGPGLLDLGLASGTLTPQLDPNVIEYTITLGLVEDVIAIAPTVPTGAVLTIDGQAAMSGETWTTTLDELTDDMLTIDVSRAGRPSNRYTFAIRRGNEEAVLRAAANTSGSADRFGTAIGVSNSTIVVGSPYEDSAARGINGDESSNTAANSGAAYVFTRDSGTWTQQTFLKASNADGAPSQVLGPGGDLFGSSVAISADTIVVGAPSEASARQQSDNSAPNTGAAYVFVRTGSTWTQQAYLKASNAGLGDTFGSAVALDGDLLVVGAPREDSSARGINGTETNEGATDSGAVYLFERSGSTWTQVAYVKASNTGAGDMFGTNLAISGETVVVGAPQESSDATGLGGDQANDNATGSGAAYVFARIGGVWSQQAYLKASNAAAGDSFGSSVAVAGGTIGVGADGEDCDVSGVRGAADNAGVVDSGAAYLFENTAGTWAQVAYLKAADNWGRIYFGRSITLGGTAAIVGANGWAGTGKVYVFRRAPTGWRPHTAFVGSNLEAGDSFGRVLAMGSGVAAVGVSFEGVYLFR